MTTLFEVTAAVLGGGSLEILRPSSVGAQDDMYF
jgi:hypothetical protein